MGLIETLNYAGKEINACRMRVFKSQAFGPDKCELVQVQYETVFNTVVRNI